MLDKSELALALGQKQKRLAYWKQQFLGENLPGDLQQEVTGLLSTYALLLSKLTNVDQDEELLELNNRIAGLEREMTQLYEQRRLRHSDVGSLSIDHER
jgi:hypothetical protein